MIDLTLEIDVSVPRLLAGIVGGKDLTALHSLYWKQTACMRVGKDTRAYSSIKRGVRQGCVLSPDHINLCIEIIL